MFEKFRDKIAISGIIVLVIGVALLLFAFATAYGFLTQSVFLVGSADLAGTIGESLPSVITTCIRLAFLGVMVWIGSLLTVRGSAILRHLPETPISTPQKPEKLQQPEPQTKEIEKQPEPQMKEPEKQPEPQTKEPEKQPEEPIKPEVQPPEPQIIVFPQQPTQTAITQNQPEKKEQRARFHYFSESLPQM